MVVRGPTPGVDDIIDAIEGRTTDDGRTATMPFLRVVATVTDDLSHIEAEATAGTLRRRLVASESFAEDADSDHTLDTFGVELITAVEWEDAQRIREDFVRAVEREGYTVKSTAIQADTKQKRL